MLQISRVQVSPKKVDGSTWDGDEHKGPNACGVVGLLGSSAAGPLGGTVATFLCESSGNAQAERDPRAPDLMVTVSAGALTFRTPIAGDTFGQVFDYRVVVPLDGIGPAGLELQVLDQDEAVGAGELIGMMRISATDIAKTRGLSPPLLMLADSRVERMEVTVLPYDPPARLQPIDFDVTQPLRALKARARAGELVRITAAGTYSVANDGEKLTPHGYSNGDRRNYNVKGFENANHAAAVALIGAENETHSSLVVEDCIATIAPVTGTISVGINDTDRDNNAGSARFDVAVALPTLDEWRAGESQVCSTRKR